MRLNLLAARAAVVASTALLLTACGHNMEQRAATGAMTGALARAATGLGAGAAFTGAGAGATANRRRRICSGGRRISPAPVSASRNWKLRTNF